MKVVAVLGMAFLGAVACKPVAGTGAGFSVPQTPVAPIVQASPSPLPSSGPPEPYIEYVGVNGASCFYPVSPYPLPKGAPACNADPNKNPWVPPAPSAPICIVWNGTSTQPPPPPYKYCQPPSG